MKRPRTVSYYVRVRDSAGKYKSVKRDTEQAAAMAAKANPIARQAQELSLTVDELTNEANTNRVSIKTAIKNYPQDRRFSYGHNLLPPVRTRSTICWHACA
jgi:hypothetical protein